MLERNGRTYFTSDELRCQGSGKLQLAPGFGESLLGLRVDLDEVMLVNSACRSAEHNADIGGHPRSLHVCDEPHHPTGGCCAIDIRANDAAYRARLVGLALERGWSVGVANTFIHLDRRTDYIGGPPVLFTY